ncbi:MAG: hypothetical protein ACYC4U_11250 [Pirellulaceae bacterium]
MNDAEFKRYVQLMRERDAMPVTERCLQCCAIAIIVLLGLPLLLLLSPLIAFGWLVERLAIWVAPLVFGKGLGDE